MRHLLSFGLIFFLGCTFFGFAQGFSLPEGQKYQKVRFQLINNVIILPLEVNGTELSFILDTGVSKPILFNISDKDSVEIKDVSEITIRGLGQGEPIKALSSKGNAFSLNNVKNTNQLLYVVMDKNFNFSQTLGTTIHGIIGYELFRDFVVEVNYRSKIIKFHNPDTYEHTRDKRSETLPLAVVNKKAYLDGKVFLKEGSQVPVRLLLDTGSSDAIWLFEDDTIGIPDKNYDDFLGRGLSGSVFGKRTRIEGIALGKFSLKDAKTAFPARESFAALKNLGNRNGSIGGEVLKRFNIVFDYPNNRITLKKNANFKMPYQYNMSGIELQHDGMRYVVESIANPSRVVRKNSVSYGDVQILLKNATRLSLVPEIVVSGIRAGSPAEIAGIQEGDMVLSVNGKSVHTYKLQEIVKMLNEREGKRIRLQVVRRNRDLVYSFVLKDVFKEKP
ncbi:MAG: PDZ domain-containing protein [Bacteroidota bacterium]